MAKARTPVSLVDLDREMARRPGGLYRFMRAAWSQVEAAEFIPGWHLEEVCTHLEAVSRGEIDRLILNIPPGCTKSLTVSVFWPAWDWAIMAPWRKWMFASFDAGLSQRDSLKAKQLVRSEWYQERFGFQADQTILERLDIRPVQILSNSAEKQDTATIYWTSGGGLRFSTSVSGKSTGWHAHIQVVDDPTKPQDLHGGGQKARNTLERTDFWWTTTMATRKADPKRFARVIMMQRLHAADLAGRETKRGGYTILSLPMRFDAKRPCRTSWTASDGTLCLGGDRRTVQGELLWPERYPEEAVRTTEIDLGPMAARAQLAQDPAAEMGSVFQRAWLGKRWRAVPAGAQWIQSWDLTFDDTEGADYVVGQVWAAKDGEFYLVDQVRARMDFPSTVQAIRDLRAKWPQAAKILIENKANGPAVIKALGKGVPGIIGWNPGTDSKEARAHAVSGYFEAGNVYLPQPETAPWVGDYVEEMVTFPKGSLDDQVDATSMALLRYLGKPGNRLKEAMANVRG